MNLFLNDKSAKKHFESKQPFSSVPDYICVRGQGHNILLGFSGFKNHHVTTLDEYAIFFEQKYGDKVRKIAFQITDFLYLRIKFALTQNHEKLRVEERLLYTHFSDLALEDNTIYLAIFIPQKGLVNPASRVV